MTGTISKVFEMCYNNKTIIPYDSMNDLVNIGHVLCRQYKWCGEQNEYH